MWTFVHVKVLIELKCVCVILTVELYKQQTWMLHQQPAGVDGIYLTKVLCDSREAITVELYRHYQQTWLLNQQLCIADMDVCSCTKVKRI